MTFWKKWSWLQPRTVELPWMTEINKVLNLHEVRDNKALSKWLRSDGRTLGDPAKLPWCGDAVETAVRRGLPDEELPGALNDNPYWARNWVLFGRPCGMVYGAIATFTRGSGGHVGFLVGVSRDGKFYRLRGGNQSNMVNDVWISANRLIRFSWPTTFPTKHQKPAPRLLRNGERASTNEA